MNAFVFQLECLPLQVAIPVTSIQYRRRPIQIPLPTITTSRFVCFFSVSSAFICNFQFQVPDAEMYEHSFTSFKPHNLDKLNWSLLDNNLLSKHNSILFKEDMKSYSARLEKPFYFN